MENQDNAFYLARLFPSVAVQIRVLLANLHFAAAALAPAEQRERDPELDCRAAALDQAYYQLLRLVDNLSVASTLEGSAPAPRSDQDLVELVREVCERCTSLAGLQGLRLTFHCAHKSHLCGFHRESIEQLLFQLLSNAFKFTPAGGAVAVELKFSCGQVLLSVSDTGCGISPELKEELFDRYLHPERKCPPPHGLGLGLPLCHRIAEGHGGALLAQSREGEGTQVTLSIPDQLTGSATVSDVHFDYTGGFNRTLLPLSDALPTKAFQIRNQD